MNDTHGCKRCGAPRPKPDHAGLLVCPRCGTVGESRDEIREYVEALATGRQPLPRCPDPSKRVRWKALWGGVMLRPNHPETVELEVTGREWRRLDDIVMLVVTFAALLFVAWCFYRVGLRWWLLVPASVVALIAWAVFPRLFMHDVLRVADGMFEYRSVGWGGRRHVVRMPANEVCQLYVLKRAADKEHPTWFELRMRRRNGESELLDDHYISARTPLLYETLIERALGIKDVPVAGEVDRSLPLPRLRRSRMVIVPIAVTCAITVFFVESCGGVYEPIYLEEGPQTRNFELSVPTRFYMSSWLYFSKPQPNISEMFGSVKELPQVVVFHIEVRRGDDVPVTLRCSPFEFEGPTFTGSDDEYAFFFGGFMRNCAVELMPGRYTLVASAESLGDEQALGLFKRRLEPRFKRRLP